MINGDHFWTKKCIIDEKEFSNILDHIEKYHKPKPEKNNKGSFYCPLCKVKVGSRQKHYCSKLHRWNVENNAIEPQYSVDDYIVHYEKYLVDIIENDKDHPFWITIKEDLNEDDYKLVKEYVNGRGKDIKGYSRHSGPRRFSRTSKNNKANRQKIIEEKVIPGFKFLKGKYLITKRQLIKTIEDRS